MSLLSVLLNLFSGSSKESSNNKHSYQGESEPKMESGEKTISTRLNSVDHRRLRSQMLPKFNCKFWYASGKDEIYVYPFDDFGDSRLPIGIVPQRYNNLLLPFIHKEYEVSRYRANFSKDDEILNVQLSVSTAGENAAKEAENQKYREEKKELNQEAHANKMAKPFCIKEDLEQTIYITDKKPFRGKEELGEITLQFHEKEKYRDPKFQEVMIMENGKLLCSAYLSIRIIRTYYSGYDLVVKSKKLIREKSGQFVDIKLSLVIGLPARESRES
ncbi:MAG: hypothetical protein WC865_18055 [Bacteroidales bacterium]